MAYDRTGWVHHTLGFADPHSPEATALRALDTTPTRFGWGVAEEVGICTACGEVKVMAGGRDRHRSTCTSAPSFVRRRGR